MEGKKIIYKKRQRLNLKKKYIYNKTNSNRNYKRERQQISS